MSKHFDSEIEALSQYLIKMADLVMANIRRAIFAYNNDDTAEDTYINDGLVNQYERLIEELCLDIIIKEHPVAKDLRLVFGVLKLISDLERIGDHAEDLLLYETLLQEAGEHRRIKSIEEMIEVATNMVLNSVNAFVKKDLALAQSVIAEDDKVDAMYLAILEELIIQDGKNEISSYFSIYTTLIIKYIERIADHAVNIAEWDVYIISGKNARPMK